MQACESKYWQESIDSKALLVCLLYKLPYLLLMGVAGAVLGSGLYLLITVMTSEGRMYQAETEYYIEFAPGRIDGKDYYNDFTWNDVMASDWILGNTMEILGSNYQRDVIGRMITADILSDVRYLTITVKGLDAEVVGEVSEITKYSLETLVSRIEKITEIDSIVQIENNGVVQIEEPLFTWRAAFLGAVCGVLLGMFGIVASFCMGSTYYTKHSILQSLNIPVFGLLYRNGNDAKGTQEIALQLALQYHIEKMCGKQMIIADVVAGDYAQKCREIVMSLGDRDSVKIELQAQRKEILTKQDYDNIRQSDGVILAIPFGNPCREAVIEKINQLKNQDCKILGAILVDVDRTWMKLYGIQ